MPVQSRYWESKFCQSVRLSVRPSAVTRVLCDKTKEHIADMLIAYKKVSSLVFLYQQRLVGVVPFHLKLAVKVAHPL